MKLGSGSLEEQASSGHLHLETPSCLNFTHRKNSSQVVVSLPSRIIAIFQVAELAGQHNSSVIIFCKPNFEKVLEPCTWIRSSLVLMNP